MSEPLVSVVVIVHDDRERLPRALASALSQDVDGLHVVVVDDASTDGSADVVRDLARSDDRLQLVVRATNSGGCGAPRNDGLDAATGRYVMFLDSDDEFEPGCVRALAEEAERTGVDVVLGRTVRINPDTGTRTSWMPHLLASPGVTTTRERPELVGDTLVVDKLYRRDVIEAHRLRFPVDIHYEDLVLTAALYAAVDRVSVLDVPVYRWYVRAGAQDRSITNRRREITNLNDRLEANRRADVVLAAAGRDDLRIARDRKVVEHDLPLYLRDLPERDADDVSQVVALVAAYTATLQPEVLATSAQPQALVLSALARGDAAEVTEVSRLAYRGSVSTSLRREGDTWRWPLGSGPSSDVTSVVRPLLRHDRLLLHDVVEIRVEGTSVRLTVRSWAPQADLPSGLVLGLAVTSRPRRTPITMTRGHVSSRSGRDEVVWTADLRLGRVLARTSAHALADVRVVGWWGAAMAQFPLAVTEELASEVQVVDGGRRIVGHQISRGTLSLQRLA
jgi:CDP-glycerol glycerophosphotransferase